MQKYIERRTNENMSIEDVLKLILNLFQDMDKQLEELQKKQSKCDKEQQEVLHYIENNSLNAVQSCKVVRLLKDIRYERRKIKDEIAIINSVKDSFVDKYKNKFIEKDIIIALRNLKELHNKQDNPIYQYQYLTKELEIRDEI